MDTQDQFKQAEEEYNRLKAGLGASALSQDEFDTAVRRLVVQDSQGQSWAMDTNGYWVKHEGAPPRPTTNPNVSAPGSSTPPPRFPMAIVPAVVAACIVLVCTLGVGAVVLRANVLSPIALAPTQTPAIIFQAPTLAPTLAPTNAPTDAPTDEPAPTTAPAPTARIEPTESLAAIMPTPDASAVITPGLYVTALSLEPPVPARRQDVQFTISFFNTTGKAQTLRVVVFIFKAEDLNSALGQTTANSLTIPTGDNQQKSQGWKLIGGGGCLNLVAQVATIEGKKVILLHKPDGTVLQQPFMVC